MNGITSFEQRVTIQGPDQEHTIVTSGNGASRMEPPFRNMQISFYTDSAEDIQRALHAAAAHGGNNNAAVKKHLAEVHGHLLSVAFNF